MRFDGRWRRYASLHDRRASIEGILTVEGLMSTGYQGQPVLHPAARLLNDVEKAMSALEEKLGLSPASRLKLGIMAKESQASDMAVAHLWPHSLPKWMIEERTAWLHRWAGVSSSAFANRASTSAWMRSTVSSMSTWTSAAVSVHPPCGMSSRRRAAGAPKS